MEEVVQNQRWYPLTGWSESLRENDPPSWSNSLRQNPKDKSKYPFHRWQVYKSEEYDSEGWVYSTAFDQDFGPKTMSSVVRSRVWVGIKSDGTKTVSVNRLIEVATYINPSASFKAANNEGNTNHNELAAASEKAVQDGAATRVTGSGYLSRISSAAFQVSKSVAVTTAKSIQEVSVFAFDKAHLAATTALTPDINLPNNSSKQRRSLSELETNESRKYLPNLTPLERCMVTCCLHQKGSSAKDMLVPETILQKQCQSCHHEFGISKYRYFCGYCGESFCRDHLPYLEILYAYEHTTNSKICAPCYHILTRKINLEQIKWRVERVKDYLHHDLIPYENTATDTTLDKALRAAEGTLAAAKAAPLGATAKMVVVSADFIRKYGRAGLIGFILRNEFMQSFNTLKSLLGDIESLSFQDAAIGTYYFMATNRGYRGSTPTIEKDQHAGCPVASDELIKQLLRYAPLAMHAIYQLEVLDLQRYAKLQGFTLIYATLDNRTASQPAFGLISNETDRLGVLLIRGSKSVQDLLTDLQIVSAGNSNNTTNFVDKKGGSNVDVTDVGAVATTVNNSSRSSGVLDNFAHHGMTLAAAWIKERVLDSLRELHKNGYKLVITGHSLGGGCAALLTVMLHDEFPELKCYAYAVPACSNRFIAESCNNYVYSVILRDDFVPRAKTQNIIKLSSELGDFRDNWKNNASEDWQAIKTRAKTLWAPRKREWAQQEALSNKGELVVTTITENVTIADGKDNNVKSNDKGANKSEWTLTRNNLLSKYEESNNALDIAKNDTKVQSAQEGDVATTVSSTIANYDDITLSPRGCDNAPPVVVITEIRIENEVVSDDVLQVNDDTELFVPGTVTHLYFCHGVYEAVHVDRECETLGRIQVYENMLNDHLGKNYIDALKIVRDARKCHETPPEWVPYNSKTRCMCCDSPFTWNSTSTSEAQQNRDQHNCRNCGWLICDGCSSKRKALPNFGINVPVRVCDRCFYEV